MKKIVVAVALVVLVSGLYAVDMGGKIGFGLGIYQGGSILTPQVLSTKVGIFGPLAIEPKLLFATSSFDLKSDSTKINLLETTFGLDALITLKSRATTNIYGIGGARFGIVKLEMEDYHSYDGKITSSGNIFGLNMGVGLEHFITESFSVDIRTLSGFDMTSAKIETKTGTVTETVMELSGYGVELGNTLFMASLFWYF